MRGRNSSKYYRRNSYKKKKLRNVLIISAICLAVLFLLFLVFGNLLNKKSEIERVEREKTQTTAAPTDETVGYSIEAYSVEIATGVDVGTRIKELSGMGVRAVSLKLTGSDGRLLIQSDIAASLGYQNKTDTLVDFSSLISKAKYYGMFSSAVFDLQFLTQKDAKQRAVMLAYESALAVEIIEKGADEVIVRAPSADVASTALLMDFAKSVKSINDSVVLGVALPTEFFYEESSAEAVSMLAESFDIVGIDASKIQGGEQNSLDHIDAIFTESKLKYYVLRYNMRVIVPQISDDQDEALRSVLMENSIQNWQKIS